MRGITEEDYGHLVKVLTGRADVPPDPESWLNSVLRPIHELIAAEQITLEAFK